MIHYLQTHWQPIVCIAIPLGFFTLLFLAGYYERRLTQPYIRLANAAIPAPAGQLTYDGGLPDPSQISEYVEIMSADIQAAGFQYGGMVAHAKTKQNKIIATVWMSPDRRIVVISGAGTVIGMPTRQTWCYTPLDDGTFLVTTDQNDEGDPSGVYRYRRSLNVRFADLIERHLKRVNAAANVQAFAETDPLEAVFGIGRRRVQTLMDRGLARWRDPTGAWWSYSARGACYVCAGFYAQAFGALTQFWRVNRHPIGSHLPRRG